MLWLWKFFMRVTLFLEDQKEDMKLENYQDITVPQQAKTVGEVVTFVSMVEVERARKELKLSQIDESHFSDAEMILAIQKQKEVAASTVVPVILDWLVDSNFILSPSQASAFIRDEEKYADNGYQYKTIGELDFDSNGNYYLVVASSPQKKVASIYKVYTSGSIQELVVQ